MVSVLPAEPLLPPAVQKPDSPQQLFRLFLLQKPNQRSTGHMTGCAPVHAGKRGPFSRLLHTDSAEPSGSLLWCVPATEPGLSQNQNQDPDFIHMGLNLLSTGNHTVTINSDHWELWE